jgi:tellurite resistance protein TerC
MGETIGTPVFWAAFLLVVLALLSLDLGVFHRKAHFIGFREAAIWSCLWIVLSLSFGAWIFHQYGRQAGLEFFAGYLIEYSLSVDNIFVFILIFSYFSVPPALHHRVLFWGILGALVLRVIFVLLGAALIQTFHWVIYIFGAFLLFSGYKILKQTAPEISPQSNLLVRLVRRIVPVASDYASGRFTIRSEGRFHITPLALVLITMETTDLIFATDSIPAIFGITKDPFIVYTSNVCAILGLRSMYFLLASVVNRFAYLGKGLGIVLAFIGCKMLLSGLVPIPIGWSLAAIGCILTFAVILSLLRPPRNG